MAASNTSNVRAHNEGAMRYNAKRDFLWLALRPWIFIPRLFQIISAVLILSTKILILGSNQEKSIQKDLAKSLLNTLTELGPCFIKLGQALSTRPDLIRRDWLDELTNLQDNLPTFPHSNALAILESELGAPAHQLFEEFPGKPIASASLGQVYKARLHGNYWVAVKIQRPDLIYVIRRDLVIIKLLGIISSPILPLNLGFGLGDIIDEFGRSLFEEIDYEREAENAKRFSSLFSNNTSITIPKVEEMVSSRKVITTSWINGTKLKDPEELEKKGFDTKSLIRTGVTSGIQQLLEFGYFHADPHPGNMFALAGEEGGPGHIAYVDFGMMDSISDQDRITLTGSIVHLLNKDFDLLAKDFQSLGFLSKEANLSKIVPAIEAVLGGQLGEEVESFNFKSITDKFSELMFDYPFRVPARFALIIRAVVSQEGLALTLDPSFKIIRVAYPYVAKKLLTGQTKEMLDILLDVIFDQNGGIRIERIESLFQVLTQDSHSSTKDLLPVAIRSLKLLLSSQGSKLRKNLLLASIKGDSINTTDIKAVIKLLTKTFRPAGIPVDMLQRINPLAA